MYSQNRYAGHEFWYLIEKLHYKPSSWSPVSSAGARTSPSVVANPFSNLTALPDLGSKAFSGLSPSVKNNKSYKKQNKRVTPDVSLLQEQSFFRYRAVSKRF